MQKQGLASPPQGQSDYFHHRATITLVYHQRIALPWMQRSHSSYSKALLAPFNTSELILRCSGWVLRQEGFVQQPRTAMDRASLL